MRIESSAPTWIDPGERERSFCLGEPDRIHAIREAIASNGGQLLNFTSGSEELRIERRVTA